MTKLNFDFATSNRIIFGPGSLNELPKILESYKKKAFIARSPEPNAFAQLINLLVSTDIELVSLIVEGEPTIENVMEAVNLARENKCNFVIGLGGGSVMDTAKVVATMLTNDGNLIDYLEVVGKGMPIKNRCAPLVTIPTTAGTGSEVTRNAVIAVPEKKVKVSMRSPFILPWVSVVDPLLTLSLPPNVTAYTGMDAFTQVIEPYVSLKANPMTDMFCREGIKNAIYSLQTVFRNGQDEGARTMMSLVSLLGGLCLANAGLGAVHGFAGVLGGMFSAPHGAICACLLPSVIKINIDSLKKRDSNAQALSRYLEIAKLVCRNESASFDEGINWFRDLCKDLQIPSLKYFGVKKEAFPEIVKQSKAASSMKGNPIVLSDDELFKILDQSY
jgi:alcohol dehydrogenase class IV